ncbi:MAG: AMP-binding protein [Cytophagaceae bacterium]|jgi:long-chain acyl-CoA synthetase|nr:AMP-binding protein [Cytophagaceae bacterium]
MLKNFGNRIAAAFGGDNISYKNLHGKINFFSSLYNIDKGDRAVVFSENRMGWIYAFYSVWKKRGIAVSVDYLATVGEVTYMIKDCNPSVVFVSAETKKVMDEAIYIADIRPQVIVIDEYDGYNPEQVSDDEVQFANPDDTALIIYTSGTTGSPKGVMLSYTNLLANVDSVSKKIPIFRADSCTMILLPLHHVLPLLGSLVAPLYVGGRVAISPSMNGADIVKTLNDNKVTIIIGVPRLYSMIHKGIMEKINRSKIAQALYKLAAKVDSFTFSKFVFKSVHKKFGGALQHLVAGGASLDTEVGRDLKTLGFDVLEGYGMTEAAPMITFTRPRKLVIGSPGEAMPGVDIRIIDGEITAAGANIMQGYYNRADETADVLRDGRLFTGDLGYVDANGYLFITGRKKEIIVLSNGKNVNSVELEEKLAESELVEECGVFFDNNQMQAVIVVNKKSLEKYPSRDVEDVIKWEVIEPFNKNVSAYKKLMRFHLAESELSRTRLGKLQRYKLPDFALKKEQTVAVLGDVPETEEYAIIARYLEKEKGERVMPSYHIELDLGMDSLDKVGFQAFLYKTFGVDVEPNDLTRFESIQKLSEWVAEKKTRMEEGKINWADIIREKIHLRLPQSWLFTALIMRLSGILSKIYFHLSTKGYANIPDGPCIIAPNHQSFFDALLVMTNLRTRQIRNTYFYAKEKHVRKPFVKFLADKNNVIVVDLNKNLKESIQKMAEVLKQQKNLIIFPEGTRSDNGTLGQFKKTFAILSRELNIPIVPVSINGAHRALPKGSKFPRPWKRINIEFLKPVYPGKKSYDMLAVLVRNRIQRSLST